MKKSTKGGCGDNPHLVYWKVIVMLGEFRRLKREGRNLITASFCHGQTCQISEVGEELLCANHVRKIHHIQMQCTECYALVECNELSLPVYLPVAARTADIRMLFNKVLRYF